MNQKNRAMKINPQQIPEAWNSIINEIMKKEPRKVTILGEKDAGKTFFSTYLANKLVEQNKTPAIVDTDTGQSDIGPPGTIGLGTFNHTIASLSKIKAEDSYFVGSKSPAGHLLEFIVGMKKMTQKGLEVADSVIVDNPGWVSDGGKVLQLFGVEILEPELVIGLQKNEELEHLLKQMPGKVRRIPVSNEVVEKTRNERKHVRERRFAEYFENSEEIILDLDDVIIERHDFMKGRKINPEILELEEVIHAERIHENILVVTESELSEKETKKMEKEFGEVKIIEKGNEKHVFISLLNEKRNLLGVGIIKMIDYSAKKIKIITPVKDVNKVKRIQIGSMKIKPSGKEIGTLRKGTFKVVE